MSPDFGISFPRKSCPYSHEVLWTGWVSAVVHEILQCPHNTDKRSIFCVHHSYHNLSSDAIDKALRQLHVPEEIIAEYATFLVVAQILDTTRRLPERWSLSNSDHIALIEDQGQLFNFRYLLQHMLKVDIDEKTALLLLLDSIPQHLTGSPLDDSSREDFMILWGALHAFNAQRQESIVQSIEESAAISS